MTHARVAQLLLFVVLSVSGQTCLLAANEGSTNVRGKDRVAGVETAPQIKRIAVAARNL